MNDLWKKKCLPCEGGVTPFDISEIHKYQKKVDGWEIVKNQKNIFFLVKNFKKVIETNSQYINAYNNLGLVYSSLGHYKEAVNSFIKTLELEKNNSVAKKA